MALSGKGRASGNRRVRASAAEDQGEDEEDGEADGGCRVFMGPRGGFVGVEASFDLDLSVWPLSVVCGLGLGQDGVFFPACICFVV
ncbi:hypothetical protein SUGI_0984520 [Cryptomeria japonica]|nr:hypothetical protein SUGI_0984520 [Cryptomeria japonica]